MNRGKTAIFFRNVWYNSRCEPAAGNIPDRNESVRTVPGDSVNSQNPSGSPTSITCILPACLEYLVISI